MRYDTFIPQIFELVRPHTRVLDVGCATGRLDERLAREKECCVVGIEKDPEMGTVAEGRCHEFYLFDVESDRPFPFGQQSFDVIILGSVLEHLREPEKLLERLYPHLKDDGELIVVVPNVAFIQIRVLLLLGKFDYDPRGGLMDNTHLRFFTLKSIQALIQSHDYKVAKVFSQNLVKNRFFFLVPLGRLWKSLFSIEFIVVARKNQT